MAEYSLSLAFNTLRGWEDRRGRDKPEAQRLGGIKLKCRLVRGHNNTLDKWHLRTEVNGYAG